MMSAFQIAVKITAN